MTTLPRFLTDAVKDVPSLPAAFSRLNAAVDDPHHSTSDIESVVREDTALAGRLLRLANSAYFGFPARIDTISRAITLVGTRQLRDLALATSIIDIFKGVSPEHVTVESFWKHSIACGLAARILASLRREPNPEQFFVAGLLHDIGRLIMYIKLSDEMARILDTARQTGELMYVCEQNLLGYDHAAVGGELLKRWNLPPHLCTAVACHHAPQQAGAHSASAAQIHVADILVNATGNGSSGERFVPPLDAEAWRLMGLPASAIGPTLKLLKEQLADTVDTLLGDAT